MHALSSAALTTSGISILGQGRRIATRMGMDTFALFFSRARAVGLLLFFLARSVVFVLSSVASRIFDSLFPFSIRSTAQDNLILAQPHQV